MLQQFRHVDGDRHPFHQSSMDPLMVLLMVCDMENRLLLHPDEVRLRQLGEVLLDLQDERRNLDELRRGDCPTLEVAHLDELVY